MSNITNGSDSIRRFKCCEFHNMPFFVYVKKVESDAKTAYVMVGLNTWKVWVEDLGLGGSVERIIIVSFFLKKVGRRTEI